MRHVPVDDPRVAQIQFLEVCQPFQVFKSPDPGAAHYRCFLWARCQPDNDGGEPGSQLQSVVQQLVVQPHPLQSENLEAGQPLQVCQTIGRDRRPGEVEFLEIAQPLQILQYDVRDVGALKIQHAEVAQPLL